MSELIEEPIFDIDEDAYIGLMSEEHHLDAVAKALALETFLSASLDLANDFRKEAENEGLEGHDMELVEREIKTLRHMAHATNATYKQAKKELEEAKRSIKS